MGFGVYARQNATILEESRLGIDATAGWRASTVAGYMSCAATPSMRLCFDDTSATPDPGYTSESPREGAFPFTPKTHFSRKRPISPGHPEAI